VLEGGRQVAELLEDGGQHEVGAGQQVAGVVLPGPAVDLLDLPAGLGHVAPAAQQVGPHEPRPQLQVAPTQIGGGGGSRGGPFVEPCAVEPGQRLELGELG
jgi:hypothetical protein